MTARLLAAALTITTTGAATFTVSPTGNDSANGSATAPLLTIARARDAVRALPATERAKPVDVVLRGGIYPQSETLVFGLSDGGTKNAPVTYRAADGETPVITSSLPVTGWRKPAELPAGTPDVAKDHLWVADMPEGLERFHVLFDGNRMLERARGRGFQSPQQKFKTFATRNTALPEDRPLLRRLAFPKGAIRNWSNPEDIEVFFCGVPWTQNISPLESVDEAAGVATLKYEGNTPPFTTPKSYNPARVENVIDVLDTPGEWCLNTRTRKIHYWPVILLCGYGPGTKDVNTHNRIENNLIERCGEIIWHGHAIFVWQSGHNIIANNLIRDVPRKAVGLCGVRGAIFQEGPEVDWDEACKTIRWDDLGDLKTRYKQTAQQDVLPFLHTRDNIVENNHVERSRTKIGDGASLNVSGAGEGNIMRRNLLLHCLGNGLRCDDWQRGTLFTENIILSGGIVHKGHNDIVNNLFLNTNIRFSLYPGQQPDPGSKVQRNLFYFTRSGIDPYVGRKSDSISTPESCDLRNNLYFATEDNEAIEKFLAEKQAAGLDQGSRYTDPLFIHPPNPDRVAEPTDITLAKGSPALAVGFQPIDTSLIGLRDFPNHLLRHVEPAIDGRWISKDAKVTVSSLRKNSKPDLQQLVSTDSEPAVPGIYESGTEKTPHVDLDLDQTFPINGLHLVAHTKDRQNSMRALTAWSSTDGNTWHQFWQADPYHIAMGRQWRIVLDQPVTARFIRIGLRPQSTLQMQAEDERIQSIKSPVLRLKQIKVFAEPGSRS